ncbi:MAG: DUF3570 domain-containing protein [Gammaproteobacteria bacterium]|jgi:hypothetical protein
MRRGLIAWAVLLWGISRLAGATVLPEERADLMYHSFDGGGVTVSGPSLLVRKNASSNTSVYYNYYVDHVSSASLDVLVGGSKYTEKRVEQTGGIDYLHGKTTTSLSYTSSVESDYKSGTLNFNMSQDFFGDLSTLTLGYTLGKDTVAQHIHQGTTSLYPDKADVTRQNYRIGLSQILTKNFIMSANWETITDEATQINNSGVTLNNPYRSYSYFDSTTNSRGFAPEKYPSTHTSNALAISGNYYLAFHAALHGRIKFYQDSWGVSAVTYQLGYTYPIGNWILDFRSRWYTQSKASFYSDMFAYKDQYTFMARDRELAAFDSTGLGITATWNFARNGWGWIDKGSLNMAWDHLQFNYHDFRNSLAGGAAGTEPLYSFGANVYQFYVSVWY